MALFKTQKNTTAKKIAAPKVAAAVVRTSADAHVTIKKHPTEIILSPRITEKAAYLAESGAYVFNIVQSATKKEVAIAIEALFKVKPRAVNIIRTDGKRVQSRKTRVMGQRAEQKKAMVFLKKGDTIELA